MLGTYYYHQILRKTVIASGTIFNDIRIRHKSSTSAPGGEIRVPLAYGPMQKFLARLEQNPDLNRAVQITLPRMSFEMTNITYDATRKSGITQVFKALDDNKKIRRVYMPVPYNIGFELNILTKLNDDALQIVEQILPYFQPSFNITIDLINAINEKRDVPIVLDNISFQDDYEGDFSTRRALIYTLNFSAKTHLFGPVEDTPEGLIKKVQVDYAADTALTAKREVRYTAVPEAREDYNDDNTATLREALTKTKTRFAVNDSTNFAVNNRIIIDNEIMLVKEKPDNLTLVVARGYDGTDKVTHLENTSIDVLTAADDLLVDMDDNFGFNETTTFYTDGRTYSPTQQEDV